MWPSLFEVPGYLNGYAHSRRVVIITLTKLSPGCFENLNIEVVETTHTRADRKVQFLTMLTNKTTMVHETSKNPVSFLIRCIFSFTMTTAASMVNHHIHMSD